MSAGETAKMVSAFRLIVYDLFRASSNALEQGWCQSCDGELEKAKGKSVESMLQRFDNKLVEAGVIQAPLPDVPGIAQTQLIRGLGGEDE